MTSSMAIMGWLVMGMRLTENMRATLVVLTMVTVAAEGEASVVAAVALKLELASVATMTAEVAEATTAAEVTSEATMPVEMVAAEAEVAAVTMVLFAAPMHPTPSLALPPCAACPWSTTSIL